MLQRKDLLKQQCHNINHWCTCLSMYKQSNWNVIFLLTKSLNTHTHSKPFIMILICQIIHGSFLKWNSLPSFVNLSRKMKNFLHLTCLTTIYRTLDYLLCHSQLGHSHYIIYKVIPAHQHCKGWVTLQRERKTKTITT